MHTSFFGISTLPNFVLLAFKNCQITQDLDKKISVISLYIRVR
jgi:hypothetical protein